MQRSLAVSVILVVAAASAWAIDSFPVSLDDGRVNDDPAVAVDDRGRAIIAWSSRVPDGAQPLSCIRVRRFDEHGAAVGHDQRIDLLPGHLGRQPAVAVSPDGSHAVVVWEGGVDGERSRRRIWMRRLDADGLPVGPDLRVDQRRLILRRYGVPPAHLGGPRVAITSDGGIVVVWRSDGAHSCDRFNVSMRRFSPTGEALGDEEVVNLATDWSQLDPDVACGADGRCLIVWRDGRLVDTDVERSSVRGRLVGADGRLADAELELSRDEGHPVVLPSVTTDPDRGFLVAWREVAPPPAEIPLPPPAASQPPPRGVRIDPARRSAADRSRADQAEAEPLCARCGQSWQVVVSEVGADGRVGQPRSLVATAEVAVDRVRVAVGEGGRALLVWTRPNRHGPSGGWIAGQLFDREGWTPLGDAVVLSARTVDQRCRPALARSPAGAVMLAWQEGPARAVAVRRFALAQPLVDLPMSGVGPTLQGRISDWRRSVSGRVTRRDDRLAAVAALAAQLGEASSAVAELAACLSRESEADVRSACALAIGAVADGSERAVEPLLAALADDNPGDVRAAAATGLGRIGERATVAVPRLVELVDVPGSLGGACAVALGEIGSPAAIAALVAALDGPSYDKAGVVEGLASAAADEAAVAAVENHFRRIREEAERRPRPTSSSQEPPKSLRGFLEQVLKREGMSAAELERVERAIAIGEARLASGRVGTIGFDEEPYRDFYRYVDRLVEAYEEGTNTAESRLRVGLARGLARVDPLPLAARHLLGEVWASSRSGRLDLLRSLSAIGTAASSVAERVMAMTGPTRWVTQEAIATLAEIDCGSAATVKALESLMTADDPATRAAAIRAAAVIGGAAVRACRPTLERLVEDADSDVRSTAIGALELIETDAIVCTAESTPTTDVRRTDASPSRREDGRAGEPPPSR